MNIYLFNAPIVPINYDKYDRAVIRLRRISIDETREFLSRHPFISAIGHQGTAQLLTQLLGIEIPMNRITVQLEQGDIFIAFMLKQRLPEGIVLTKEQLEKLDYWLVKGLVVILE
jgi:hypothetical protein